jgi:hypothetical protein
MHALEDLTQIMFAGLADAIANHERRGVPVPPLHAPSRRSDPRARGLGEAVEHSLDDLAFDARRAQGAALELRVTVGDIHAALATNDVQLVPATRVAGYPGSLSESVHAQRAHLAGIGRYLAVHALLDELRQRERPS